MKQYSNFKRGKKNIEMILLNILQDGDCYGYQLTQLINKYSGLMVSIPEGSLYPMLYKLEENGYITSSKKLVGKRMERVYYHIEPAGIEYMHQLIYDFNYLSEAINTILSHNNIQ